MTSCHLNNRMIDLQSIYASGGDVRDRHQEWINLAQALPRLGIHRTHLPRLVLRLHHQLGRRVLPSDILDQPCPSRQTCPPTHTTTSAASMPSPRAASSIPTTRA
jgi:hypothetical protein